MKIELETQRQAKEILKEALEKVNNGEFTEILVIARSVDGEVWYKSSTIESIYNFFGAIDQWKYEVMRKKRIEEDD